MWREAPEQNREVILALRSEEERVEAVALSIRAQPIKAFSPRFSVRAPEPERIMVAKIEVKS